MTWLLMAGTDLTSSIAEACSVSSTSIGSAYFERRIDAPDGVYCCSASQCSRTTAQRIYIPITVSCGRPNRNVGVLVRTRGTFLLRVFHASFLCLIRVSPLHPSGLVVAMKRRWSPALATF